jgi:hypothetical protein
MDPVRGFRWDFGFTTLLWHWFVSIRAAMSCAKQDSSAADIQHVDLLHEGRSGTAINAQLIFACTVFAAASFLFGFDDKIISPVAALVPFVSVSILG